MRTWIAGLALAAMASTVAYAAPDKPKSDKSDPDRMICRREAPIGSLIQSRKTCLTAKQWQDRAENGNEQARKLVYDNQGRPTGN